MTGLTGYKRLLYIYTLFKFLHEGIYKPVITRHYSFIEILIGLYSSLKSNPE